MLKQIQMSPAKKKKFLKTLGENLHRAREQSGLSLTDVKNRAGISKGNMSKMEHGANPTVLSLHLFCGAVGADLAAIIPKS
jgi:transcriptional regulator with XRE-family HTH domain